MLVEANCNVTSIEHRTVVLDDGRTFQSDTVILACGLKQARKLLKFLDDDGTSDVEPVRASTLDVTLSSRPVEALHGIVDPAEGAYLC